MDIKCIKCGSKQIIKNGVVFGWQRYKCKDCGYQFTKMTPGGKPIHIKMMAHSLYAAGLSMREIAKIVGVTVQSVSRWIKKWHIVYQAEYGEDEIIYHVTKENLSELIDLQADECCLLISNSLPSGAKVKMLIQMPEKKK